MKSKWLLVLTIGLAASLMVFGCGKGPQPLGSTASIAVDKKVSNDGGINWYDEATVPCGSVVKFQVKVGNTGQLTLNNVWVYDDIPQGLDYVEGSAMEGPQSEPSGPGGTISWLFGNPLTPGAAWYVYFSATAVEAGTWVNNAQATGEVKGVTVAAEAVANVTVNVSNCSCTWGKTHVAWTDMGGGDKSEDVSCEGTVQEQVNVKPGTSIVVTANPICTPSACTPLCNWYVYKEGNPDGYGSGCIATVAPEYGCHAYRVDFTGKCSDGGTGFCPNCSIYLCACNNTTVTNCTCTDIWKDVTVLWVDWWDGPQTKDVHCGDTVLGMDVGCPRTITVSGSMGCVVASTDCQPSYTWDVYDGGSLYTNGNELPAQFDALDGVHSYTVTLHATCGDSVVRDVCPDCKIYLNNTNGNTSTFYARYYNYTWQGTPPPDTFNTATVVFGQSEPSINHDWGTGGPDNGVGNDCFMADWMGRCYFDATTYTFSGTIDDGIEVLVDGTEVSPSDLWGLHTPTPFSFSYTIPTAGWHDVEVKYFERWGTAVCQVSWVKQ